MWPEAPLSLYRDWEAAPGAQFHTGLRFSFRLAEVLSLLPKWVLWILADANWIILESLIFFSLP